MINQLSFSGFVWKNLWRWQFGTLPTLCGIGVAIGAFVALVSFANGFEQDWLRIYTISGTDIAVVQRTFLSTPIDESVEAKLRSMPVVAPATPRKMFPPPITSAVSTP